MSYLTGRRGSFHTNHGLFGEIPYEITPELIESRWDTLDLRPGMDGFSGPPTLEKIPNYNPDNDPGITRMAQATDPEWLNIIKTLTGKLE